MSIKISELPQASTVNNTDLVPIVQGGSTKKAEAMLLNLDNYSTTEQRIGTWIDGKPLYKITLTGTIPSTSVNGTMAEGKTYINIPNIDLINIVSQFFDGGDGVFINLPYLTNAGYQVKSNVNASYLSIYNGVTTYNGKTFYVTLNYTKTTDTATTNLLNTTRLMNTGELVGMGDRVELTSLANELTDNNVGEQEVKKVTPSETTEEKTEGSGDTI